MFPLLALLAATVSFQEPMLDSVVPELAAGPVCASRVELRNLGANTIEVSLEAHLDSGALVPLDGQRGLFVRLEAGQRSSFQFAPGDAIAKGWVKLRALPVVALSGAVECTEGDRLRTVPRQVAFAMRDPWFDGDVAGLRGAEVLIVNTEARPAAAQACYSAGSLYSVPGERGSLPLQPVCSAVWETQLAPFATVRVPIEREENTHFSLRTRGAAVVLEMLRPLEGSTRLFTVDSNIHFGEEVHNPQTPKM